MHDKPIQKMLNGMTADHVPVRDIPRQLYYFTMRENIESDGLTYVAWHESCVSVIPEVGGCVCMCVVDDEISVGGIPLSRLYTTVAAMRLAKAASMTEYAAKTKASHPPTTA